MLTYSPPLGCNPPPSLYSMIVYIDIEIKLNRNQYNIE